MSRFNAPISSKGGRKDGDDDVFWQDPHDNWEQTQLPGIACDCCQKLTGAQTVHQMCNDCYITVCRDCIAKGEISNLDSHAPHEVGDFDWVKHLNQPGSGARGQPSMAIVAPGRQANTPSASATKGKSSASKSSSKKGGKAFGKDSASRMTQTTLTSNQNSSLALYTPTKVKNPSATQLRPSQAKHSKKNKASKKKKKGKKTYYNSDSYSDFDDDDMSAPSDKEYVPPAEVGGKGSTPSAAVATAGRGVAPVGLAQSRPVRAAAINTYEKMRSGSVKKEEPDAQDEVKMSEIPEAKKSQASKGKTSRLAYGDSAVEQANIPAQDHSYAQQGQVQGGGAYLHAPQYGEGYRHRGLPQLHPGVAHKANASPSPSSAHQTQAVHSHAFASPAIENKRAATAAEKAPAAKRQNTRKMDSLTAGMSSMSAGTIDTPNKIATPQKAKATQKGKASESVQASQEVQASQAQSSNQTQSSTQVQAQQQMQIGNPFPTQSQIQVLQQQHVFSPQRIAPNVTPEEREASRRLVTASMVDIMDAIQHKVKLHVRNGGVSAAQQYDSILREVVHGAWVANIVLTLMKRRNGELAAFQLLRGYTNTIIVNMNLGQCPLTRNWMDATDKDIQSTAAFVPDIVQINEVQSAVQPSLTFPINGEDVVGANTLMFMSAGGHGN
ncbi:hypothetical protein BDP81DRAFT_470282 [Colletotrichum phormii]|uniref:Uncharacterized protein n=1 Tax=Colletotrichum phormii TaxID=359342 RepID=A0AAJ0EHL1_9PEZI|nr:uncharacterized protein BDP81DRAFT_470282 [Colletotrichum phormii]KAK1639129.1 hypothetical protein BDP81DRAFT_470282 [Colletotrichum phormii]